MYAFFCFQSNWQFSMLAVNVSNPSHPYFNQIVAQTAIGVSIKALEGLGASQMLSSRVWTVLGDTCRSATSDLQAPFTGTLAMFPPFEILC